MTLRIENHVINFSWVYETGVAGLTGRPIGPERNVKDVCKEDEKENANQQWLGPGGPDRWFYLGMVQMDLCVVFYIHEKLRNGYPELRMDDLGSDFTERDKNELSMRHLGVRDAEGFFLHDKSVVQ